MDARKKILDMLAQGLIQPEEAYQLLQALKSDAPTPSRRARSVVVHIEQEGRTLVHIRIPLALVKMGARFIPRSTVIQTKVGESNFDLGAIHWEEVLELAAKGEIGELVTVDAAEDGVTVRVFCE